MSSTIYLLTHFLILISFCTSRKHQSVLNMNVLYRHLFCESEILNLSHFNPLVSCGNNRLYLLKPFSTNVPLLYPLKTSVTVF